MSPLVPTGHERRLDWLTTNEVATIDKGRALVVLPIGAVEQHGPHLPCYTDSAIAEALVTRALAALSAELPVWALPLFPYGKSNEHTDFAGTISLSTQTLLAALTEYGSSIARSGFRKLAFVNAHGGQVTLLEVAARDIRAATGLQVFPVFPYRAPLPDDLPPYGVHGDEIETSIMLALAPDSVRIERLEPGGESWFEHSRASQLLSLEGAFPTAWLTPDVSANGVIGDPRQASAKKGERVLAHLVAVLTQLLAEICEFEFSAVPAVQST